MLLHQPARYQSFWKEKIKAAMKEADVDSSTQTRQRRSSGLIAEYIMQRSQEEKDIQVLVLSGPEEIREEKIPRHEMLQTLQLSRRDLRTVELRGLPEDSVPPAFVTKDRAIVLNLIYVRAIVTYNRLYIFSGDKETTINQNIREFLAEEMNGEDHSTQHGTFELKALEAVLGATHQRLTSILFALRFSIQELLDRIAAHSDKPEHLHKELLKHRNSQVCSSNEDMIKIYLTDQHRGRRRNIEDHEEVEFLLEASLRQIQFAQQEMAELRRSIATIDEYLNFTLDHIRNRIMKLTLFLTAGSFSTALCSLSAGIFGMNLHSGMEEHPHAFYMISGGIVATNMVFLLGYYIYCKKKNLL
ncbi:hypothetical protein PROFUN_03525 [Planoprotostelium fungivorum]|uniref:Magnesium transporter n=1 Tax=Planoprotostelium fungivorum TaxID=1890364 RepID=A0A2P6MNE0_9EUKA|nr:hypothetical protein PROFUN_03525 [Planoprotostelium fungivorum]